MRKKYEILLVDGKTNAFVKANIIEGVMRDALKRTDEIWKSFLDDHLLRSGTPRSQWPQHHHWNWQKKHEGTERLLAYRMFGVESESEMQGLMLLLLIGKCCRIESQEYEPLVYIDFLAAAPWNISSIVEAPRYRSVGSILVGTAIQVSQNEGFKGRIGLHSLPQAESWYRDSCNMTDLGIDPSYQNLRYFEMTHLQAQEFLEVKRGKK